MQKVENHVDHRQCMQLDHIYNVDHSTCSLENQYYIPIKIASKFNLIISSFQNQPGAYALDPSARACYAHKMSFAHKETLKINSVQGQLGPPNFFYFCLPCLSSRCPSPYLDLLLEISYKSGVTLMLQKILHQGKTIVIDILNEFKVRE